MTFRFLKEKVMSQITLSISDETLLALKLTPEQLSHDLVLVAAVKLYEGAAFLRSRGEARGYPTGGLSQ